MVLSLRTAAGIKLPVAGADLPGVAACIDELVDAGLLDRSSDRAVLTRRGRLLANEVAVRLLLAVDPVDPVGAGTR